MSVVNTKKSSLLFRVDEVKELEEVIRKCANSIIDLEFIDKTCDDKDCKYCNLARVITDA